MDYSIGDTLLLERTPFTESGTRYPAEMREISNVSPVPGGRTMIMFEDSPVWFWTREGSEWIGNTIDRFRNLNLEAA